MPSKSASILDTSTPKGRTRFAAVAAAGVFSKGGVRTPVGEEAEDMPQLKGEFWITPNGLVSVGKSGPQHSGYAINEARAKFAASVGAPPFKEPYPDETTFRCAITKHLRKQETWNDGADFADNVKSYLGDDKTKLAMFDASMDVGDIRDFAMREWGWKWLKGSDVGTWRMTPDDLKQIHRGVELAMEEQGLFAAGVVDHKLTLRVGATGRSYQAQHSTILEGVRHQEAEIYSNALSATNELRKIEAASMPEYYRGRFGD